MLNALKRGRIAMTKRITEPGNEPLMLVYLQIINVYDTITR
jgi:hypothetical protein